MFKKSRWLSTLTLATLFGCSTLSPDQELNEAASLLEPRIGFAPDWSPGPSLDEPWPRPLSLEDAVRLAVVRHPQVRIGLSEIAEQRADLIQAGLLPNPVVSLAFGIPIDSGGGTPATHGIMQPLAALWSRPSRIAAAQADLRTSVFLVCHATVSLATSVGQALAALHHSKRQLALSSRESKLLLERVELLQAKERAGEATRIEVNAARIDLAKARERQVDDQKSLGIAESHLLERLGSRQQILEGDAFDFSTLPAVDSAIPSETDLLDRVATQRLDVVAAFTAAEGSDARTRLASLERLPQIGLGVGTMRNFEDRDAMFPSAQLTVPIFDVGRAAIAKAEAVEQRSLAQADRILNQAVLEVRLARLTLLEKQEHRHRIQTDLVAPRTENHSLAELAYEVGEGSRIDCAQAEARLLEAKRLHEAASLAARLAYFELLKATGGSLHSLEERRKP